MTVVLDKSMGETPLAEVEFNMADFNYGEYKPVKLYLKKCTDNDYVDIDPDQTYLDIGLKGTRANHNMDRKNPNNPFRANKNLRPLDASQDFKGMGDRPGSSNGLVNQELDKLKKENR